jgi:hypothetical protein
LKQNKLPELRDNQFCFNSTVYYTYNYFTWTVDYRTTGMLGLLIRFLTVYLCITFHFFALALGGKGVFYSYKKILMLHFCNWKKKCTLKENVCSGKIVPNKNLGKKKENQNHTCTIRKNTTNSFIPLGSNIQFSTNTEKEQIIRQTCNN